MTSHHCGADQQFQVLFSSFGLSPDSSTIPDGIEIASFDETAGVFNYYKEVGAQFDALVRQSGQKVPEAGVAEPVAEFLDRERRSHAVCGAVPGCLSGAP